MALNISDTEELFDQIIPTAEFKYSPIGVTMSSERLNTARFVPYDVTGKCRECPYKVDHVVSRDGIWTRCKHLKKKKFVPFDFIYDLPGHCCFRLENRGNVFNLPYKTSSWSECDHQKTPSSAQQVEKQPKSDGKRNRKGKEERPTEAHDLDKMLNLVADAADYVHEVIAQKEEDNTPNESAKDQQNGAVDQSNSSNLTVPTF